MVEASTIDFAVGLYPGCFPFRKDVFIVYTSNIFAILGLRSLYFALSGIMDYFYYLKYALAGILSFIGIKMCQRACLRTWLSFHISNFFSLGVIRNLPYRFNSIVDSGKKEKKQCPELNHRI